MVIEHPPLSSREPTLDGTAESASEEHERPPMGKLLRELRGERSLRQVEADTGIANSYLSNLESGLKRPGVRTLAKLSRYYQAPLMDLLEANGIQVVDHISARSHGETAEVQRSYQFVLADPLLNQISKPAGPTSTEYQEFIVKMYEVYTGKRLL